MILLITSLLEHLHELIAAWGCR